MAGAASRVPARLGSANRDKGSRVSTPRIVVGMSVWNEQDYLSDTIPAVLEQTMQDFRLVVTPQSGPPMPGRPAVRTAKSS